MFKSNMELSFLLIKNEEHMLKARYYAREVVLELISGKSLGRQSLILLPNYLLNILQ